MLVLRTKNNKLFFSDNTEKFNFFRSRNKFEIYGRLLLTNFYCWFIQFCDLLTSCLNEDSSLEIDTA